MELHQERISVSVRKRIFSRGQGAPSWWSSRGVWTVHSDIELGFWVVLCGASGWTQWSSSLPTWDVLLFCDSLIASIASLEACALDFHCIFWLLALKSKHKMMLRDIQNMYERVYLWPEINRGKASLKRLQQPWEQCCCYLHAGCSSSSCFWPQPFPQHQGTLKWRESREADI